MPFGMLCRVDPRNRILDGSTDHPCEWVILRGKGMPRHARRHSYVNCAKKAEPIQMLFGLWTRVGPRKHVLYGAHIPPCEEAVISGKDMPGHARRHSAVSWAKWLNRSICHLGCGLGCAEGSTSSIVFAGWRQCALMGGHTGATWRIRFNRPSAAAMRPYVKLLWPLVIIGINIEKGLTVILMSVILNVCRCLMYAVDWGT